MRLEQYSKPVIVALDAMGAGREVTATATMAGVHADQLNDEQMMEHVTRQIAMSIANEIVKAQAVTMAMKISDQPNDAKGVDRVFTARLAVMPIDAWLRAQHALAFIASKEHGAASAVVEHEAPDPEAEDGGDE